MTITNYFAAALIAVAPSALMAEDYPVGVDLSLGYAFNEDDDSETTAIGRVYAPIMGGFGVQADLDYSYNNHSYSALAATIHGTYEINSDLAVGVFYGSTDLNSEIDYDHRGVEVIAGFDYFEVSAVAGTLTGPTLIKPELEYYVLDASTSWFENYTVGARFDKIETLEVSSSLYVSRDLGNGYGLEARITDIEERQFGSEIGFTLTKAIGGGAKFGDARALVKTMWTEPTVEDELM